MEGVRPPPPIDGGVGRLTAEAGPALGVEVTGSPSDQLCDLTIEQGTGEQTEQIDQ